MFILKRILSSGSNVPEPQTLPATPDVSYKYGAAIVLREGIAFNTMAGEVPTYICCETATNASEVTCYAITPNMIFEAPIKGAPTNLYVGDKVKISTEQGYAMGVNDVTTDGYITIFDLNGAKKSGDKIYVRFN